MGVILLVPCHPVNREPAVLRLPAGGLVDPDTVITRRFPLSDVVAALDMLNQNRGLVLRVLITSEDA